MNVSRQSSAGVLRIFHNIPTIVIWALLLICFLPVLLILLNVGKTAQLQTIYISGLSSGMVYFNIWLIVGISAAIITGALSFVDYIVKRSLSTTIIGMVLLAIGLYELFSYLYALQVPAFGGGRYSRWFISRSMHALLITGTIFFFTYLNPGKIHNPLKKRFNFRVLTVFCLLVLSTAIILTLNNTNFSVSNFHLLNYPLELITLSLNLILAFYILPDFITSFPALFSRLLALSMIPAALANVFMAFHKQPFDLFFNSAYFFRLVHFLIPLLGIGLNYIESSIKEKKIISRLRSQIRERINIQRNLVQREALLAKAEKIARLGSWYYDIETEEQVWSDEMFAIFGLDAKEYVPNKSSWRKYIVESYQDLVEQEITNAIRHQKSYNIEYQIKRADGTIRHVLGQGHFLTDEKKLVSILRDVSEMKEASFNLAQSEALLKEAESLSHNGSWEWSQEKNSFYWSDEMYRIHGLIPYSEEVDLRFYLTLIHPDDVQHFVTILADTQTTLAPFSIEYRIIRANGEVRYLSLNGKFKTDFSGNVKKVLGNTQDITELKNTSILLEKSESIYRTIAKNVPDSALFLFDNKLSLLLKSGPALLNIDPDSDIADAESFQEMVFQDPNFKPVTFIEEALSGKDTRLEIGISSKTYKITFTPVYLSRGEVLGIMVVMHDITDIKFAQQTLEVKVEELNRSNEDLEQFAYIASHDLQEPLRKIRAFGERLNVKYSSFLPEEGIDYISRMGKASERMQLLIDDLLAFSRISRPGEELQPVSLADIVNQVINDLEIPDEKGSIAIDVHCSHKLKVVPSLLRQMLQNLLSNSLKFAKKDVPLIVTIQSETVWGKDFPVLKPDRQYCKIEVKDNGIGFDNQYASKIFTLFHRLHSRNEYEGTGIGLAICKKIVENHNGIIEAEGKENEGALFRLFLPISKV